MSLSILNNISALTAENSLSTTQTNLQNTLTQLSTGLRINSGADDAAGLSIANGMQANIAALTQSGQNATNATGMLQTADGALSQVTSMLDRAVTLATEASSAGLSSSQQGALQTEFNSIMTNITNIGTQTKFNGTAVFGSTLTPSLTDGTTGDNLLGTGNAVTIGTLNPATDLNISSAASGTIDTTAGDFGTSDTLTLGNITYTFTANSAGAPAAPADDTDVNVQIGLTQAQTLQNLANAINGGAGNGTTYNSTAGANAQVSATAISGDVLTIQASTGGNGGNTVTFTNTTHTGAEVIDAGGTASAGTLLGGSGAAADLNSTTDATTMLNQVNNAINIVAQMRGQIGANINQLTAVSNVMTSQVTNLQSASNGIMNADIGKTVANMTQYNVLQSTGMSALQQANQAQQAVLKLLQ
jgi:flagellin